MRSQMVRKLGMSDNNDGDFFVIHDLGDGLIHLKLGQCSLYMADHIMTVSHFVNILVYGIIEKGIENLIPEFGKEIEEKIKKHLKEQSLCIGNDYWMKVQKCPHDFKVKDIGKFGYFHRGHQFKFVEERCTICKVYRRTCICGKYEKLDGISWKKRSKLNDKEQRKG